MRRGELRRLAGPLAVAAALALALAAPAAAAPRGSDDARRAAPSQVIVGFEAGATAADRERAGRRVKAERRDRLTRGGRSVELFDLPAGASNGRAIDTLEDDPAVAYAEPDWLVTTAATSSDPYFIDGSLWGMYGDLSSPANQYGSQAAEAWSADHVGSHSVVVGVIDEGIQTNHPDLDANVWVNPFDPVDGRDNDGNGYVDDKNGWDFANNDNSVYDGGTNGRLDKHGTHVAGTIGAEGSNGAGVAGASWSVTQISLKFLGRRGGTTSNAIRAVDYLTDIKRRHGLDVVASNNSWGGGGYSQALYDAIARGQAADILFVAAAGNGGSDGVGDNNDTTPHYPSSYNLDGVVAVASITSTGAKSSFSNYGAKSVDLGAPGSGIASTLPYNAYGSYSGTSMATPHVTGAAALRAATFPERGLALKQAILGTTIPTASLTGKTVTGGRLDASGY